MLKGDIKLSYEMFLDNFRINLVLKSRIDIYSEVLQLYTHFIWSQEATLSELKNSTNNYEINEIFCFWSMRKAIEERRFQKYLHKYNYEISNVLIQAYAMVREEKPVHYILL